MDGWDSPSSYNQCIHYDWTDLVHGLGWTSNLNRLAMKNTKSLERSLKLAERQNETLRKAYTELFAEADLLSRKDELNRKIYDLGFKINSLRREKHRIEAELKKLFEA